MTHTQAHNKPGWEHVCPTCGHLPIDHHGNDHREHPSAGCMAISGARSDWCRCPLTYEEARR